MATIKLKIKVESGGIAPQVRIDQNKVSFGSDGKGQIHVDGDMGDGSKHLLEASIQGPLGAKLTIEMSCGNVTLPVPEPLVVLPDTEPYYATSMTFKLEGGAGK